MNKIKNKSSSIHTFVVLAYKESVYLEECIKSVVNQKYNSKVVIAMCDNPWTKETDKFLHCFVTYQGKDGIEIVFDATLNIIMEKELYLKLFKANIISEIEREKMISDIEYIQANKISVTVSEYLCFPEEIVQGVKRYVKNK